MKFLGCFIKSSIIIVLLSLVVVPFVVLLFSLESTPLVVQEQDVTMEGIDRIKALIKNNDPRNLKAGEIKRLTIVEKDLNHLIYYLLPYLPYDNKMQAKVSLQTGSLRTEFTLRLPKNPLGHFVNVLSLVSQSSPGKLIHELHVGSLAIPAWLQKLTWRIGHRVLKENDIYQQTYQVIQLIKNFQFQKSSLILVYQWQPEVMDRLQAHGRHFIFSDEEKTRLAIYHQKLAELARASKNNDEPLTQFIRPMFSLANERASYGNDPVLENRALIFMLATYVAGKNTGKLFGLEERAGYQPLKRIHLTLLGRRDLAQHFMISSAITVAADTKMANMIGLLKEVDDSKGGSGFSFADLAADQAGVQLAEVATKNFQQAKRLQERMKNIQNDNAFMPSIKNLPEGIMELEFRRRYQDLDSEAYNMLNKEIKNRIASCHIYR